MKKILFVCTGNTCRSPMAEGFFNKGLSMDEGLSESYSASSAGLAAFAGGPASLHSVNVMKDAWGIDISTHRSRNLTRQDIVDAHLVLTMTGSHRDAILINFPEAKGKVYTLSEYAAGSEDPAGKNTVFPRDITDPYGASAPIYAGCAAEIKEVMDKLLNRLRSSAE